MIGWDKTNIAKPQEDAELMQLTNITEADMKLFCFDNLQYLTVGEVRRYIGLLNKTFVKRDSLSATAKIFLSNIQGKLNI